MAQECGLRRNMSRVYSSLDVAEDLGPPLVKAADGAKFVGVNGQCGKGMQPVCCSPVKPRAGYLACDPYCEEGSLEQLVDLAFENGGAQ